MSLLSYILLVILATGLVLREKLEIERGKTLGMSKWKMHDHMIARVWKRTFLVV